MLADALTGTGLRADLVPAGGDGSGWHLRTQIKDLRVAGSATDATDGATVAVVDWGTLTIAAQVDLSLYRKSKRGPKKPPPKRGRYKNGGHVSTYKLLAGHDP